MDKFQSHLHSDSFKYTYFDINKFASENNLDISKMPFSHKIILENLIRNFDGINITQTNIQDFCSNKDVEISFMPARVLMQDFTGVPAIVDLAAMRDEAKILGANPECVNPQIPVHLVIDHSISVEKYGNNNAEKENTDIEFRKNFERYKFLKWGQSSFDNVTIVPPGCGICHQVNLEYIAQVVWHNDINGVKYIYPDTVVGTDSHTTMVNGLGVLGWGVGGIEAEAAMLGQSISMNKPQVIGFKMTGKLDSGVTATDLVLTVTQILRKAGVVGKFVEFFGSGLVNLSLPDRATIANMAPEYGATCGLFPIDDEVIKYLKLTGRSDENINLVKLYAQQQGMWGCNENAEYDSILELDLSTVRPSLAGPKRPQDRVNLEDVSKSYIENFGDVKTHDYNKLDDGSVVIAAITSCTNTSNPYVLMGAGLLAKKACEMGLLTKPFVKTSLAPGSRVVTEYLAKSGLQEYLDKLGFNVVGYGCTTCIGNSGPLKTEFEQAINDNNLTVSAVISGNRNFEGRVHPLVKANYLASPALVVAYAIAGNVKINLDTHPLGQDKSGKDIFLKDIWPSKEEIENLVHKTLNTEMFKAKYAKILDGGLDWQSVEVEKSKNYAWSKGTYIEKPPYFEMQTQIEDIKDAKILAIFGDSVTTDHISPAGDISISSPAGKYLIENNIPKSEFNSYGARRGSHNIMMRGTFANIRIKNEMLDNITGGFAKNLITGVTDSIFDIAMQYKAKNIKSVIFAGKEYGTGSSRDWAAKGPKLLGISAVIAESFERIHRTNLVCMGIMPLQLTNAITRHELNLQNCQSVSIIGISPNIKPSQTLECIIHYADNSTKTFEVLARLDTVQEVKYYITGGVMNYVVNTLVKKNVKK